jgi:hypothetical protein
MQMKSVLFSVVALGVLTASVMPVSAQTAAERRIADRLEAATKKLHAACGDDLSKFCGDVAEGQGRLLLCLMAHEDKISAKCDYALYDAGRNLERALDRVEIVADACWKDIEANCGNVPAGGGRIGSCLVGAKDKLSAQCKAALTRTGQSQ